MEDYIIAMLVESGLLFSFWGHCLVSMVYVWNCFPIASLPNTTLFEAFYKRCGGGRQKTLHVILTYVEITSSGVNCALKNSRGGKSRSGKSY